MTVDMTNNRVPYGLLTDEEKAALHEHEKAGGLVVVALYDGAVQQTISKHFQQHCAYRTVPLPAKTQDVIAWDRLPEWAEWAVRFPDQAVWAFKDEPSMTTVGWYGKKAARIDDFPGIVQIGTCDWRESKQWRPRLRGKKT
jgi:hypothetical protein